MAGAAGNSLAQAPDAPAPALTLDDAAANQPPDLFLLLTLDYKPDDIAEGLATAIRRSGRPCERVSDYQVFTRTETLRTLKVKCPGQEIYGLSVWRTGQSMIYGGDGMLRQLDPEDGPVVTLYGTRVANGAGQGGNGAPRISAVPTATVTERPGTPVWLVVAIAANVALLALIGTAGLLFWRAEGAKAEHAANHIAGHAGGLGSDQKDRMMDESREVLPDVYHHPSGIFIVRGRHGKRRLFRNILFAMAYRNWGLKLREIR
ncbi:MAG: hypothetical protein Tsb0016_08880 [Sphingomonadales bacterium]